MADLFGTAGNDGIVGPSTESNRMYGFDGNDGLYGGALADRMEGGQRQRQA
jgi:Ca2+-binding RTX toxin-like protein